MYDEDGLPSESLVMSWGEHNAHMDDTAGIEPDFDGEVTLTLRLSPALAGQLCTARMKTFVRSQVDRFEVITPSLDVMDDRWDGGQMMWCGTAADAMLRLAYEEACGFGAGLLWDLTPPGRAAMGGAYVVLTDRPI